MSRWGGLMLLVIVAALCVVAVRHQNRLYFVELQVRENRHTARQAEWGRLMLEKATWVQRHNMLDIAGQRLAMAPPAARKIVTLRMRGQE